MSHDARRGVLPVGDQASRAVPLWASLVAMSSVEDRPRFGPEFYEVGGRVMIALARHAGDLRGISTDLDWWESGHGGLGRVSQGGALSWVRLRW